MATDVGSDELNDVAGGEHKALKRLGKYRIERTIGAGGMGTVFLAIDTDLNRTVALKVLPKDRAGNPVLVKRFKAEGQAAAHMEHPNIVRVFEAGEADGFLYMALEYVEGIDVFELVERRGVVPVKRSIDIIRQTTEALQHAYDKGIVHRDIKPSNLLIKRDGSVKLADMGLARSIDDTLETNITRAGTTVGTVDYMSPEQARNSKAADVRSDIYSLGCTWYHMLTGHPPFPEGSMTNKLQAHAVSIRPDPRSENDNVPEGVVAIIQRMMACKPEDRYQTPQDVLDDLVAASRMKRTFDESALAALADNVAEVEESDDEIEPMVRVGDIDDVDLASLRESAEFEVNYSPPKPIESRSKKDKKARRKAQRAPSTREDAPIHEEEPSPPSAERAFAPIKDTKKEKRQAAARRSPPPVDEPESGRPSVRSKPRKKRETTTSAKSAKRGSVTKAGGAAPELPAADPTTPVDGSTRQGIDLELLRVIVPAVLVVAALIGIGYAIMTGGNSLGEPGDSNPYANEQSQEGGRAPAIDSPASAGNASLEDESPQQPEDEVPQVTATDFPGAEDAAARAPDQLPLIPGWVEAFRHPAGQAERTLRVRRRPSGDGQLASLNEALRDLPTGGGTIEVDGSGPFPLQAITVSGRRRVQIQAARGTRPVIQLRPGSNWSGGPLVDIRGSQFEFSGLHFVLVDAGPEGGDLFAVTDGNISLRDCSITVVRQSPHPLTAIRVAGAPGQRGQDDSGKCLLEDTVIRGENLTAVSLDGKTDDLVIGNCLLASGAAPAIVINADDSARGGAEVASRGLRLLATTILATRTGIELRHAAADGEAPVDVIMRRALLLHSQPPAVEGPSSMTTLWGWPRGDGGLSDTRLKGLTWQVDQSTFVGWSFLLKLLSQAGDSLEQVTAQTDAWRKFWNQGLRSDAIVAESLPYVSAEVVTPESVQAQITAVVTPLNDGQLPGCRPADIVPQPLGLIEHVVAAVRQPHDPDGLGQHMAVQGEPIRFDLSLRRNLARFIAGDSCPDGGHIIAFGSGLKEIDPIVIENKSIRLEFENTDKSPLVIQPVAGRDGAPAEESLMTVKNGTLDLVGVPLKLPASQSRNYPKSLIFLQDASLSVRHSTIEGPRVGTDESQPLIRWGTSELSAERSVLIEDSFLVGVGSLLAGPVRWNTLVLRNSVLASKSNAIDLKVSSSDAPPATLVIDHCTIATDRAAIRADVAAGELPLVTVHTRASVFAGPLSEPRGTSVVVAHSPGAGRNGTLVWWGSANGFSDRLAGSFTDGNGQPGDFERDWIGDWGTGHEANPLTGKADVLFLKPLPDLRVIEPISLALSPSSTAATWGPAGEPIGAHLEEVGAAAHKSETPKQGGATTSGQPAAKPGRNNPGF